MKKTNFKLIISGSTIEAYYYKEKEVFYDFVMRPRNESNLADWSLSEAEQKEKKIQSRKSSMMRSGLVIQRLVNTNAWKWYKKRGLPYLPVFLTFTFRENIKDIKVANSIFSKFIKRLNYSIGGSKKSFLKYVVVIEFQDFSRDGVVHYHAIFFNLNKIWADDLAEIWDQGFIKIKSIKHVDNVGRYISKYMVKHFEDGRLDGQKRYFSSRGLLKPNVIKNSINAYAIVCKIPKKYITHEKEFDSKYTGKIKYKLYKLNKDQNLIDLIPDLETYYD